MNTKIPFGLKDGQLVHVDEVDRGLECGCICPGCKGRLIARHGDKSIHHFAHAKGEDCETGFETALHLAAKDVLMEMKQISVPSIEFEFNSNKSAWALTKPTTLALDDVVIEERFGSFIPDVVAYINGVPLLIEIYVTHQVDEEKLDKIRKLKVSTLEIDLSNHPRLFERESLKDAICLASENKKWLFSALADNFKSKVAKAEVKMPIVSRGMAQHVDYCPIEARVWKGKPYANFIDDCCYCPHCSRVEDGFVYCMGMAKVDTFEEFEIWEKLGEDLSEVTPGPKPETVSQRQRPKLSQADQIAHKADLPPYTGQVSTRVQVA